jgi:hypothetical protein
MVTSDICDRFIVEERRYARGEDRRAAQDMMSGYSSDSGWCGILPF